MSIIGWWLASGSVANFVSYMILSIVALWYPEFEAQNWQQYLIYVAVIWLAVAMNVFASEWLPHFNQMIFVLSVSTLGATIITLFVTARNHHATASFIFTDTTISSGWSDYGLCFLLSISNAVYGYLGTDCGAHLCEEIANPSRNVPKVIIYPLVMGLLTSFPFAASLLYSITDLSSILESPRLPLISIYYQATGSYAAASVLLAVLAFCFFGCLVAVGTHGNTVLVAYANARQEQLALARSGPSRGTGSSHSPRCGCTYIRLIECLPTRCFLPAPASRYVPSSSLSPLI